jgi:PIN domain nuclease of toxin-antitoxin system
MNDLPVYVLDTHALYWQIFEPAKLSPSSRQAIQDGEAGKAVMAVPYIALAELFYLLKKLMKENDFPNVVALLKGNANYRLEPLVLADIENLAAFPEITEMHDRLFATVSQRLGATIVTKDPNIQASPQVKWLW